MARYFLLPCCLFDFNCKVSNYTSCTDLSYAIMWLLRLFVLHSVMIVIKLDLTFQTSIATFAKVYRGFFFFFFFSYMLSN